MGLSCESIPRLGQPSIERIILPSREIPHLLLLRKPSEGQLFESDDVCKSGDRTSFVSCLMQKEVCSLARPEVRVFPLAGWSLQVYKGARDGRPYWGGPDKVELLMVQG